MPILNSTFPRQHFDIKWDRPEDGLALRSSQIHSIIYSNLTFNTTPTNTTPRDLQAFLHPLSTQMLDSPTQTQAQP
jgi:hypothetical protein